MMTKNVGTLDRVMRIVLGLVLIVYALKLGMPETSWNWVGWIGVIPLITGLVGSCGLYSIVGINTCSTKS